jgi:hypothetical protein
MQKPAPKSIPDNKQQTELLAYRPVLRETGQNIGEAGHVRPGGTPAALPNSNPTLSLKAELKPMAEPVARLQRQETAPQPRAPAVSIKPHPGMVSPKKKEEKSGFLGKNREKRGTTQEKKRIEKKKGGPPVFYVHLGTFSLQQNAVKEIVALKRRFPALARHNVKIRTEKQKNNQNFFRILAGPLKAIQEANDLRRMLGGRKIIQE